MSPDVLFRPFGFIVAIVLWLLIKFVITPSIVRFLQNREGKALAKQANAQQPIDPSSGPRVFESRKQ